MEKAEKIAVRGLNTPNAMDDFTSLTLRQAVQDPNIPSGDEDISNITGMDDAIKKLSMVVFVLALLSLIVVYNFVYRIISWLVGFFKPRKSEERSDVLSIFISAVLLYFLTGYTVIFTAMEILM